jgi:transcriptional regulator with XRE-family HTH domain
MQYDRLQIGQKLRDMRRGKKYTVEELGDRMGISVSHVNQIERGSRNMSMELLVRFINIFDTDANSILMDIGDMKPDSIDAQLRLLPEEKREYLTGVFRYMISTSMKQVMI